ncbi:hypothetical protein B5K08_01435 [Rhizobium leguminosarum bv. trifolii]|uniref:Uncharacterized protein n=1 Tax=Rhizobium leguminosarum bv. trifolii TaxID=386 RepID=A0A3E1C198_RHILT|nr:hypothetical protein B5K08_01435 [Rhizobium leguminosarum bv. trifolii]RFC01016.1 hypothetical protein B5K10_01435 [Rhizobium leguminosarum bv. trifolii]
MFPNGLRKFVADDPLNPTFHVLDVDQRENDRERNTLFFDPGILCSDCDGALGPFDTALIRFVEAWVRSPCRQLRELPPEKYQGICLPFDAAKLRLAILICIYRFVISTRHPKTTLDPYSHAMLEASIHALGRFGRDPTGVMILGYYQHWMTNGSSTVDVTEIGRPHPAAHQNGFVIELFGLSIFVDMTGDRKFPRQFYLGEDRSEGAKVHMHITSVENSTATFKHFLDVLKFNGFQRLIGR